MYFTSLKPKSIGNKLNSFAQKRSSDVKKRYTQVVKKRDKLVKAQYLVDGSLKKTYQTKVAVLDRKVNRLRLENRK